MFLLQPSDVHEFQINTCFIVRVAQKCLMNQLVLPFLSVTNFLSEEIFLLLKM